MLYFHRFVPIFLFRHHQDHPAQQIQLQCYLSQKRQILLVPMHLPRHQPQETQPMTSDLHPQRHHHRPLLSVQLLLSLG